jgi:hypothetical protein
MFVALVVLASVRAQNVFTFFRPNAKLNSTIISPCEIGSSNTRTSFF